MSHSADRHARLLHAQSLRRAWASLGISALALGVGAGALALQRLGIEPYVVGFQGFWVAEPQGAAMAVAQVEPVELLSPLPEDVAVVPPTVAEVAPPSPALLEEVELPPMPELLAAEADDAEPFAPPAASSRRTVDRRTAAAAPRAASAAQRVASAAAEVPASAAQEGEFTPPAYWKAPKPPYPASMRQSRIEGSVQLRIALDAQGHPRRVDVVGGSGHVEFDSAARLWVLEHWQFKPARRGAQAVPGTVLTRVHFVLN